MTKLTYGLTPRCLAANQTGIRKGEQCKRYASGGQHSCWQHRCRDEACNNKPLHIHHDIPIVDKSKRQKYYFTRSEKGVEKPGDKAQEPKAAGRDYRAKNNAHVAQVVEIDSNALEIQMPRLRQNSGQELSSKAAAIDDQGTVQHSRIRSHKPRGGIEVTRSKRKEGAPIRNHWQDSRKNRVQDDNDDDDDDDDKSMSPSCPCRCSDTRSEPRSFTESFAEEGDHSPGAVTRSNGKGKEPFRDSFAVPELLDDLLTDGAHHPRSKYSTEGVQHSSQRSEMRVYSAPSTVVGASDAYEYSNRQFQNECLGPATCPDSPSIASSFLIGRSFSEEVADALSAYPPARANAYIHPSVLQQPETKAAVAEEAQNVFIQPKTAQPVKEVEGTRLQPTPSARLQGSSEEAVLAEALARNAKARAQADDRGLQPGPSNTEQDFPVSTQVADTATRSVNVGARATETGRLQHCFHRQQIPNLEIAAALTRNDEARIEAAARGIQLASPSISTQEDVAVATTSASQQHVRAKATQKRVRFQEPLTLQSATIVDNAPVNQDQYVRRRPTQPENRRQCSSCASGETRWLQESRKSCLQSVRRLLEILGNRNGRGTEGDTELLAELKRMLARLQNCR